MPEKILNVFCVPDRIFFKIEVQNLKVLKVVAEKNLLVLKGSVPGHKNSFVTIRK